MLNTYSATSFVVMQVHFLTHSTSSFASVDKFSGEFETESNIIRASTPFPIAYADHWAHIILLGWSTLVAIVASTTFNWSLRACPSNRMSNCCTSYGIDESCFSTTCNNNKGKNFIKNSYCHNGHLWIADNTWTIRNAKTTKEVSFSKIIKLMINKLQTWKRITIEGFKILLISNPHVPINSFFLRIFI